MNIVVTGYPGVGSSAVFDLLCEYSTNGIGIKEVQCGYEHFTFYMPGGLFDLEDKLILNNDLQRSDEALLTFENEMKRLNKYNFGWFGSFKKMFGNQFEENLNQFIEGLQPCVMNTRYYWQIRKVIFNPLKIPVQLAAKVLTGRTIYKWGREFIYRPMRPKMRVAFPSADEFYDKAKGFVRSYMEMFKEDGKENTIFDRMLLCHNLYRIPRYFDDDFRVIRVRRDIRDLYVKNKYINRQLQAGTMYPSDFNEFVFLWRRMEACEKPINDKRILTVNFEDLVYDYDKTVRKIEEHCGLNPTKHVNKKKIFDPDKSIKNTQIYKLDESWKDEIERLEIEFPNEVYAFPFDISTTIEEMFTDSRATRKKGLLSLLR